MTTILRDQGLSEVQKEFDRLRDGQIHFKAYAAALEVVLSDMPNPTSFQREWLCTVAGEARKQVRIIEERIDKLNAGMTVNFRLLPDGVAP